MWLWDAAGRSFTQTAKERATEAVTTINSLTINTILRLRSTFPPQTSVCFAKRIDIIFPIVQIGKTNYCLWGRDRYKVMLGSSVSGKEASGISHESSLSFNSRSPFELLWSKWDTVKPWNMESSWPVYPLFIWSRLVNQKVPIMFEDPATYCQNEICAFMMLKIKFVWHIWS